MKQFGSIQLTFRRKIELQILGITAVIDFFILVFTPVFLHLWVNQHRMMLMWIELGILLMIILVLWSELYNLKKSITKDIDTDDENNRERYKFYDEKGDLKLVLQAEMLYYLEAADNYVVIHYMNAGKMEKMLIRNTLKNIEWRLQNKDVVRCHRSYLVNLKNVQLIRRKEGDMLLDFGNEKIQHIPISKTYSDNVLKYFSN